MFRFRFQFLGTFIRWKEKKKHGKPKLIQNKCWSTEAQLLKNIFRTREIPKEKKKRKKIPLWEDDRFFLEGVSAENSRKFLQVKVSLHISWTYFISPVQFPPFCLYIILDNLYHTIIVSEHEFWPIKLYDIELGFSCFMQLANCCVVVKFDLNFICILTVQWDKEELLSLE